MAGLLGFDLKTLVTLFRPRYRAKRADIKAIFLFVPPKGSSSTPTESRKHGLLIAKVFPYVGRSSSAQLLSTISTADANKLPA